MPSKKPVIKANTDQWLIDKMKIIAEKHRRSLAGEIEFICREHIEAYEQQNGPIILPELPPTGKELPSDCPDPDGLRPAGR
jgi:hypothetical protein